MVVYEGRGRSNSAAAVQRGASYLDLWRWRQEAAFEIQPYSGACLIWAKFVSPAVNIISAATRQAHVWRVFLALAALQQQSRQSIRCMFHPPA